MEKVNFLMRQAAEDFHNCVSDSPPYYYKVAYEEAERFLENLK
jgi:hypothetical protein